MANSKSKALGVKKGKFGISDSRLKAIKSQYAYEASEKRADVRDGLKKGKAR